MQARFFLGRAQARAELSTNRTDRTNEGGKFFGAPRLSMIGDANRLWNTSPLRLC